MTATDASAFARAFEHLTGYSPFRWQERLYERFVAQHLPTALDLPTGLGKTSVMAIWLLARVGNPKLPRRLVYVVDRRAVVDQATEFAELLRRNAGVLGIHDLPISTLRGQYVDNREWLENPARPAIIVGTIDMIGSRLLFEGYVVSRNMRPYQAGLLGADTLFVLDEAHLCPPFEALLRAIQGIDDLKPKSEARRAIVPTFRLLPLSATGREAGDDPFRLEPSDTDPQAQPVVYQRFTAGKRLALHDLPEKADLAGTLTGAAWALGEGAKRVLVYCHSRDVAKKVAEELMRQAKEASDGIELLVGARRVREREKVMNRLRDLRFSPLTSGTQPADPRQTPAFLVATSAGEVGVDIDADHMVCDLVAFERMVQRLGRVNRRGGKEREAIVDVFCVPPEPPKADAKENGKKRKTEARIALFAATRAVLAALPAGEDDRHDASPGALAALKTICSDELIRAATTPEPLRPALDRAVVDAWSMTSLREHPGRPEPEPWLRGWIDDEEPQTQVIWRRWLPWRSHDSAPVREEVEAFFAAARPHASEILEAPVSEALDTLISRAFSLLKERKSGALDGERPEPLETQEGIIVLTAARDFGCALTLRQVAELAEKANARKRDDLKKRAAYGMVVVAAALGGLNTSGLLDAEASAPPEYADNGWTDPPTGFRVLDPGQGNPDPDTWKEVLTFPLTTADEDESRHLTVVVSRGGDGEQAGDRAVSRRAQELDEHGAWAANEAGALADALGLDSGHTAMLVAAARAHDLGKNRALWQNAMRAPRDNRRPYAKTTGKGDPAALKIGPHTYRHEFGSLRDLDADPAWLAPVPEDLRELARHLIAAHHGYARPIIAPVDPGAAPSASEARARDAALRFAHLQRGWGPWGLAWWEAVLRAADWRASSRLDKEGA